MEASFYYKMSGQAFSLSTNVRVGEAAMQERRWAEWSLWAASSIGDAARMLAPLRIGLIALGIQ